MTIAFSPSKQQFKLTYKKNPHPNITSNYKLYNYLFLTEKYKSKNLEGILELQNKTPVWNDETQSYVLNFHGRVTQVRIFYSTVRLLNVVVIYQYNEDDFLALFTKNVTLWLKYSGSKFTVFSQSFCTPIFYLDLINSGIRLNHLYRSLTTTLSLTGARKKFAVQLTSRYL